MSAEQSIECAICFESITLSTSLPCACKVDYCMRCWDRALAQGINACGQARCPTCRAPVRVDLDVDRGCLMFSREVDDQTEDPHAGRRNFTERLLSQARPAQIKLLQQHGALYPDDQTAPEDVETIARRWSSGEKSTPPCICGSRFMRVSGEERASRCVSSYVPGHTLEPGSPDFERILEAIKGTGTCGVMCDICDQPVLLSDSVWTCKNDQTTIFHATSYDVCDRCFFSQMGANVAVADDQDEQTTVEVTK